MSLGGPELLFFVLLVGGGLLALIAVAVILVFAFRLAKKKTEQQSMEALAAENQRLRDEIARLTRERGRPA